MLRTLVVENRNKLLSSRSHTFRSNNCTRGVPIYVFDPPICTRSFCGPPFKILFGWLLVLLNEIFSFIYLRIPGSRHVRTFADIDHLEAPDCDQNGINSGLNGKLTEQALVNTKRPRTHLHEFEKLNELGEKNRHVILLQ